MDKSKAYKEAHKDLKQVNMDLIQELDEDYEDICGFLDFTRKKNSAPQASSDPKIAKADEKGKGYDIEKFALREDFKVVPVQAVQTEHDRALSRRKQIEELNTQANAVVTEAAPTRKRDEKAKDKREVAIEKVLKEQASQGANLKKAEKVQGQVTSSLKQAKFDDDLKSDDSDDDQDQGSDDQEEEGEADDEGGESMMDDDDQESGEEDSGEESD